MSKLRTYELQNPDSASVNIELTPSGGTVLSGVVTATTLKVGTGVTISSGVVTATSFSGPLTGNVTGNVTGNLTGTASTATAAATAYELSGTPNLNVGVVTATTYYGSGANLTGIDATQIQTGNTSVQTVDTGSDGHVKITTEGTERWRVSNNGTLSSNSNDTVIQNNIYQNRTGVDILRTETYQIYISDSGNDSTGDGSSSSPWRTLQKAFNNVPRLFAKTPVYIRILGSTFNHSASADLLGAGGSGWGSQYSGEGIQIQADTGTITFNLGDYGISFEDVQVPIRFKNINFVGTNGTTSYNGIFLLRCHRFYMDSSCTWSTGIQGIWSYFGGLRAYECTNVEWRAQVTVLSNGTSGLGGLFVYKGCQYVIHTGNMLKNGTRWGQAAIAAVDNTFLYHENNLDNFDTGIRLGINHYSNTDGARCMLGNTKFYNLNYGVRAYYMSSLRAYYAPTVQNVGTLYNMNNNSFQH